MVVRSDGYDDDVFGTPAAGLAELERGALKVWLEMPVEFFREAEGVRQTIGLRDGLNVPSPGSQLAYRTSTAMRHDISLRQPRCAMGTSRLAGLYGSWPPGPLVHEAWNGMRRLPYSDGDIAVACGTLLELCAQPGCASRDGSEAREAFRGWRSDALEVEFGAKGRYQVAQLLFRRATPPDNQLGMD